MDSASTFIRRKKQSQQHTQQQTAPFSQFSTLQHTGPLFTPPSASYPAASSSHNAHSAPYSSGAHSLRRREPAGVARINQSGFLPPAAPQRSLSSTGYAPRSNSTERHAPSQAWGYEQQQQQQQFAQTQPRPSGSAAGARPHRVAPDTLPRRSYPSPPSTAPTGAQRPTLGALPYAPAATYSGHAASDEGARARALLIDRERRQIFSYLSSPNCFLFSVATGPVGLTEEDLDLLLAAGGTSVWTLMHLRALDAAGARFKDFANLIPAVARASQAQAEQNRQVLAWLTSTACTLFGPPQQAQGGNNGPDPSLAANNPVLLSMADIERLVIESGAGLDTLALLERLQEMQDSNRAQKCDTFQSLIEQMRESVHQIKASNNAAAAAAANAQQAGSKKGRHKSQGSVHDASPLAQSQQAPSEADSEDRRLVLEYLSSGGCALFSRADPTRPVVATAAALDALLQHCGGSGAQTVETLMRLDQQQSKFAAFAEILPALKAQQSNGAGGLKPLLTPAQVSANRALIHAYLSSPDCMLFSERADPLQATGRDFDTLCEAAGGDANECVRIMTQLDAGTGPDAQGMQQEEKENHSSATTPGMRFQTFPALIQAVSFARAAQQSAQDASSQALVVRSDAMTVPNQNWTPEQREEVLAWLSSPACTLFSSLSASDVTVHLRELDLLMTLGAGSPPTPAAAKASSSSASPSTNHTLCWLQWLSRAIPLRQFDSFAAMSAALAEAVETMRTTTLPKLTAMLAKPNCALFHAPQTATATGGKNNKGLAAAGSASSSSSGVGKSGKKDSASKRGGKSSGQPIPGTGAAVAARVNRASVEELVFASGALLDAPVLLDTLVREGRSFPSLSALQAALAQAHADKRALSFVTDGERGAVVDFLSKESCTLFSEEAATNDDFNAAPGGSGAANNSGDLHVKKSDLDRLIVEGRGLHMTLFYLSALNASGRQFARFPDLIPAVRHAHALAAEQKQDLFQKLQQCKAQLFPTVPGGGQQQQHQQLALQHPQHSTDSASDLHVDERKASAESLLPHLSQADADALYIDGSAGGATIHYLDIFLDSGSSFTSWAELVSAVRELHALVLRNRYAAAVLERSEARLSAQERRNVLLAYLYSSECALFSDAEDVNVSDEDVDALQAEAAGLQVQTTGSPAQQQFALQQSLARANGVGCPLGHALLFLRYIDWSGRKFLSFAPLRAAVRDCFLASIRQKKAILDHLRTGVDAVTTQANASATAVKNAALQSQAQGAAGCKLLSATAAHLQRTLDLRDVDRLFVAGGAGPVTLAYLLELEDAGLAFASLDALVHAVRLAHQQAMDTRATEKKMLLAYLGSGACPLLNPAATSATSSASNASHGASSSSVSSAPIVKAVSDMELVTLLNVGKGGVSTLFLLQALEAAGRCYPSFPDLLQALKESREGGSQAAQRKKDCAALLRAERCQLLRDPERTPVTQHTLDRLFADGGAGAATLAQLWSLQVAGHSFSSVDSLAHALRLAHEASVTRAGSERGMLLVHLLGPCAGGVLRAGSANHGLAPLFWLKLSAEELDQALALCEGGANALRFLLTLARAHRSFDSWPALLDALSDLHEELRVGRSNLLARLTNSDECSLFQTASGTPAIDVHSLTLADMDALTVRTQDARKTLFLLDAFETRRARFASFADLVAAVSQAHFNTLASIKQEKSILFLHLTSAHCSLLAQGVPILEPELDALFLVAGSAKGTLFYLAQLEARHAQYATVTALLADVEKLHEEACKTKADVLAFFHQPGTRLLYATVGATGNGGAGVTTAEVDRLYIDCGVGMELLPLLRSLEAAGSRFVNLAHVAAAVRDLSQRRSALAKEERLLILAFLSRPDCRLFKGPVAAKPADIDALIAAGGGAAVDVLQPANSASDLSPAAQTLELLREMEAAQAAPGAQAEGVDSFPSLISAVSRLRSQSQAQRAAVLAFLTSPRCFLFKDSPEDVIIDLRAVGRLFSRAGAGSRTLEHVRALGVAGGRFGSFFNFNELIEAVRALHQQATAREGAEGMDGEALFKEEGEESKSAQEQQKPAPAGDAAATARAAALAEQQSHARAAAAVAAVTLPIDPSRPAPSHAHESILPAGSIQDLLTFLHSPLRRLFRFAGAAGRTPQFVAGPEAEALVAAGGSTPAYVVRLLTEIECGSSTVFSSVEEMAAALQLIAQRESNERKSIAAFLSSNKCRLHKLPKHAGSSPSPTDSPDALIVNPQYTDAQVEELCVRSGAGVFTLHHLHRLNEDHTLYAPDLVSLTAIVTRAHADSVETIRQQKQMVRTFLASFHSQLLWCVPHAALDLAAGGIGAPVAAPFRHRLRDSELNHLLLESGGSGSMLLRHLMRLDESRLQAAASQQEAHSGKTYHSVSDLLHAVRDVHHHELASKKDLLDYLNSGSCQLWDNSASSATPQAPSSYSRIASHDVDRLFNGTRAHFDAPLLLGLLAASGRRFTHAQALVDAVKEERVKCSRGPAAEALMILAHLVSPLCTVLPRPSAPSSHVNSGAIPVATLDQLLQLLQIGGGGSATLFELYELESAGVVAPDFANLVQRVAAATGGGPSMIVKEQLMSYLSEQSSIYRDAAARLEQLYGHNAANQLSTDSLAVLPVTAAGVSRMMEESSCGIAGVLNGLRNLDRAQLQLLDLRSTVEALADLRMQLPLHERAIELRRAQLHADKAAAAGRTRAPSPVAGHDSRWSEDDRRALLAFLSHPDTLLFSESAAALEVTPALLDKVLDSADPIAAVGSQEEPRMPSAQEALVILAHLNQSARKIADLSELISTMEREHAAMDQIAQLVADRLKTVGCALWVAGKQPPPSALTAASVRGPLLLDSHTGPAAMQRLDELELCGRTFAGLSQLAAALSELQQGVQARSAAAKDRLVSHLSQAEVSGTLFSQAVSMGDVELAAILTAGRGGANNVRASVDAARAQHRSFDSVSELLARIRGDTQQNEQELLSFLHSPAGSALLSPPAEAARALAFLDSHLLSCMAYVYGSVDAGPETLARVQKLSDAQCSFKNMGQLMDALRDPATAVRKQAEKSMQPQQPPQQPIDGDAPLAPAPEDVDALVAFLQDPSTLLFADSSEDLKIETDEIMALFASSVSNSIIQHGTWATTEPHLRSLNAVHRRMQHFNELAPAIRRALAPAQSGCYVSQEQLDEISTALRLPSMDGLFVGTSELEGITQTHADDLLRLIPIAVVSLSATASGVTELLNHLFAFSRAKRLFPGWPVLRAALINTISSPSVGHVSEATLSAVRSFFASAENKLFAPNVEQLIPTGEEVDSLVLSAGGVDAMLDSLHAINAQKPGTIQSLAHLNSEMANIKAGAPGALSLSVAHSRRTSFVAALPRSVASSSSEPSYPPLSADDTAAISAYLSSCNLFSTATTELEVNMSTLDALAYECGSVPDLIDMLKKFDRAGVKFLTFSEVAPKVDEELKRRKVHEPISAEPIVRMPSTPRPDTKPLTPFRTPSVATAPLADSEQVLAPDSSASSSAAPTDAASSSAVAPVLSDADRNRFVDWLQSDHCRFFVDSSQDLTVTLEQLDLLVVVGHGVENTLATLQHMSNRGVRFQAFADILPALTHEIAQPTVANAPAAAASSAPAAASSALILSDAERDEIVAVLSNSSLFSETAETLELQPSDLDSMASDAGSVGALIAALKDVDAKHTRPRNFKELYAIMQAYWTNKPANDAPSTASDAAAAAAPSSPSAAPAVVVSPSDQADLVAYISSENCGLFSEAAGDLTVEPHMLDALIIAGGGLASLLATLRGLDMCVRRFQSFSDLQPAVLEARESGGHIGAESTAALVGWLGECSLFSQSADPDSNFEVTVADMDALVAAGRGMSNLMPILARLDREGLKVERFAQLALIVMQQWNSQQMAPAEPEQA